MEYLGYVAELKYDEDAGVFFGKVANTRDVISFEGASVDELHAALREAVDGYIAFCTEKKREPARPYSGKFPVRCAADLHRRASLHAAVRNLSLNQFVIEAMECYLGPRRSLARHMATTEGTAPETAGKK